MTVDQNLDSPPSLPVLILDDERDMCEFVADVGTDMGFKATWCDNFEDFACRYSVDLHGIFLDLAMPGMDGVEIIRFLADNNSGAHLVLMSGYDADVIEAARRLAESRGLKVAGALHKPFGVGELSAVYDILAAARAPIRPSVVARAPDRYHPDTAALGLALDDGHVVPWFQAKFCARSRRILGAEVLARWLHPDHGMVGPDRFIGLAEREGMIDRLTDSVIRQALAHCRNWRKAGFSPRVALNLSPHMLHNLDLPDALVDIARDYEIPPEKIIIEITETALAGDFTAQLDILTRLRMRRFGLSIDDFGTGYSSLKQLQQGPFTELKVDQSFVAKALAEEGARAIVESSIQLGHRLGLKVVAEGIETEEQMDMVCRLGCDEVQGYLLGRPCAADAFSWPEA
ncbi:diguanylate phosphodiesterase [Magnetospirillum sp. ME-1]|uniref:EAL domain-containing response regulator n=1 Tax=Magnetospirillum sp. ME-1 TaxID=1639348 RepID=UPI000A17A42A|nr:EAL domain-containing response regulator [Magnetospirillum sp. ME-1]ARJ65687.1 diguanylate phosphodiesterase [Magnetospirillum sp. ME-1]